MKASSSVWKTKDKLSPRKFKVERSARTVMLMAYWDSWGLSDTEFGTDASKLRRIMSKKTYFNTLLRMRNTIKEHRCRLLS